MSTTLTHPRISRTRKQDTIEVRVTAEAKALLVAAALVRHTSMSNFVLSSAVREAQNTLADQRVFKVSDENWSKFMAILEAPAKPDPGIVALAHSQAPWNQ